MADKTYNVNNLMRNVLITPAEVMYHAPTKHTLDVRMIEQSIIIAEERWIRPELGFALYDAMATAKNITVTAGNLAASQLLIGTQPVLVADDIINSYKLMSVSYQALWKQYLWKLTAECVVAAAYPEAFVQFTSEGINHTSPPAGLMVTSGSVVPLLSSAKWSLDKKVQDRIAPMISGMHGYLCKFKTDYTLYDKSCPDCNDGETKSTKWAGLAVNMYDDLDEPARDCCT